MANAKKPAARKTTSRRRAAKKTSVQVDRGSRQQTNDQSEEGVTGTVESTATEEYQPSHPVLENAGLDQDAAEEDRQAELQAERDEHNLRTGDASQY